MPLIFHLLTSFSLSEYPLHKGSPSSFSLAVYYWQPFAPTDGITTVENKKAGIIVNLKQYTVTDILVAKAKNPACIYEHLLNMHGAATARMSTIYHVRHTLKKLKTSEELHANCRVMALALQ
jgi:hypothetical protein